jgi:uncharacterized protein YrrD
MKASDLRGMPLVSMKEARKLGKVQDVIVDTTEQRIVALQAKIGSEEEPGYITVDKIHAVGKDAITLEDGGSAREGRGPAGHEGERGKGTFPLKELQGDKVISYDGTLVGTVSDLEFDPTDFRVTEYEVGSGPLAGITKSYKRLRATPDMHVGEGIITVSEQAYGEPGEPETAQKEQETAHETGRKERGRSHH